MTARYEAVRWAILVVVLVGVLLLGGCGPDAMDTVDGNYDGIRIMSPEPGIRCALYALGISCWKVGP